MNAVAVPFAGRTTSGSGSGGAGGSRRSGDSGEAEIFGQAASTGMPGVVGGAGVAERDGVSGQTVVPARSGRSAGMKRLEARIRGLVGKAIADYRMIEDGDRVDARAVGARVTGPDGADIPCRPARRAVAPRGPGAVRLRVAVGLSAAGTGSIRSNRFASTASPVGRERRSGWPKAQLDIELSPLGDHDIKGHRAPRNAAAGRRARRDG